MSYYTELSSYKVDDNFDDNMCRIQHQDTAKPDETGPFDAPSGKWVYYNVDNDTWSIDDTINVYRTLS